MLPDESNDAVLDGNLPASVGGYTTKKSTRRTGVSNAPALCIKGHAR